MAMDMTMGWLQTEQRGPASELFSRLWAAQEGSKPPPGGRQLRVPDLIDHHVPPDYLTAEAAAAAAAGHPPPSSRRPLPPQANGSPRERSCTTEFDLYRTELVGRHGGTPWMEHGRAYSTGVNGLHEEIEDFFSYMSPTKEEHFMREGVYSSIRRVILSLWDGAKVFIFGSFETGLYLPTSDIDIVVMGSWEKSLEMLKDALVRADICDSGSIKVLDKAAVPIIKLTDRRTDVKVDISFNMKNGLLSASTIKQYQREYPQMPKLVIALKQFLLQRELNEVFTGGISSYSLILMTVGFLQDHERQMPPCAVRNLGVLLIEFFELYGLKFNYLKTCIKVKDRGYAPRSEVEEQFAAHSAHNSPLCIEDPHNSTNDIGRSSYNMMKVKEAFKYAYQQLSGAVLSPGLASDPNKHSILGRVIQVTDRVVEYRQSIRIRFPVPPLKQPSPQRAPSSSPNSSTSPMSSGTSDVSDQDAEASETGTAERRSLVRAASPANSSSTSGGTASSSSSGRSAPPPASRSGPGPAAAGTASGSTPSAASSPGSGSGSGPGYSAGSGYGAGSGHGPAHGSGRGSGHNPGLGRRSAAGTHYPSAINGPQHQPPPRSRRGQPGGQQRRKTGGSGSASQSDSSAVVGGSGGRPSRHQAGRAGPRDS